MRLRWRPWHVPLGLGLIFAAYASGVYWMHTIRVRQAQPVAAEGQTIVAAMCRFKEQTGLWPQQLEELVPDYLPTVPSGWHYRYNYVAGKADWRLIALGRRPMIETWRGADRWRIWRGGESLDHPRPPQPSAAAQPTLDSLLAQLDRRIARRPKDPDAWRMRVSTLLQHGRVDEALADCARYGAASPRDWWPRLTNARLLTEQGKTEGVTALAAWAAENPGFANFWCLSLAYRQAGQVDAALQAVYAMTGYAVHARDAYIFSGEAMAFDAALFAYEHGHFADVDTLCDTWHGNTDSPSDAYAMQALARLALGNFAGAVAALARTEDDPCCGCSVHGHAQILDAIQRGDSSYRHAFNQHPRSGPGDYLWECD